jgi:hypothetical protein
MSDMRQQLDTGAQVAAARAAAAAAATGSSTSSGSGAAAGAAGTKPPRVSKGAPELQHNKANVLLGGLLPGSAAYNSSSFGAFGAAGTSVSGSGSSAGNSLMVSSSSGAVPTGAAAAAARRSGSGSGCRVSASQWQQQQWQQQAFGELLHPQPALQRVTVADVSRMKQVVPGMQAPCVSELAAAVRSFPVGALSAATAAAGAAAAVGQEQQQAGLGGRQSWAVASPGQLCVTNSVPVGQAAVGSSPKGLRLLLSSQQQRVGEAVGSPCFAVGAGGRLAALAGGAAVAAAAGNAAAGGLGDKHFPPCGRR